VQYRFELEEEEPDLPLDLPADALTNALNHQD
jgi:hypothetical protein